jgi:hypothetical protein
MDFRQVVHIIRGYKSLSWIYLFLGNGQKKLKIYLNNLVITDETYFLLGGLMQEEAWYETKIKGVNSLKHLLSLFI